jgi:hypothetical protein
MGEILVQLMLHIATRTCSYAAGCDVVPRIPGGQQSLMCLLMSSRWTVERGTLIRTSMYLLGRHWLRGLPQAAA